MMFKYICKCSIHTYVVCPLILLKQVVSVAKTNRYGWRVAFTFSRELSRHAGSFNRSNPMTRRMLMSMLIKVIMPMMILMMLLMMTTMPFTQLITRRMPYSTASSSFSPLAATRCSAVKLPTGILKKWWSRPFDTLFLGRLEHQTAAVPELRPRLGETTGDSMDSPL